MSRPPAENEEARAFAEAMRDARKLQGPGRVPVTRTPSFPTAQKPHPRSAALPSNDGPTASGTGRSAALVTEEAGELWSARANGIDRRFARKLAAGKIPVEARVDLHGRSRSESTRALERFLAMAAAEGRRCVLVIHGRGLHSGSDGPALREAVREALTGGPHATRVLACSSAPPALSGAGATLVWLRR
jgi:DNA-nicking Smr family endonuclease